VPRLVVGPLLRHVGARDATVWVETDAACEVEVCGCRDRTFELEGHHFALVHVTGLEPAQARPYDVRLDREQVWPLDDGWPASCIRTLADDHGLRIAFGSCRVGHPDVPPWTLSKDQDPRGREHDALRAMAMRMRAQDEEDWPHLLLLLGDQVYADEVPPATAEFIAARRDTSVPPGEEVADFEEYCRLYRDSWSEPAVRWLLSTIPSAMIFDDHDVHDDWNTSRDWVRDIRAKGWWDERIVGGFMAYWAYQHLGNLSPEDRMDDTTYRAVRECEGDAGPVVRAFAFEADREVSGARWSYRRDIGRTRIVMMDSRAGRVLRPNDRRMVDAEEWDCIERWTRGSFDHVLLGTSLPAFLARGMHHLEAWNEAVCEGAWGAVAAGLAEKVRRIVDLEHWAAFHGSLRDLEDLVDRIASGRHGDAPGTVVLLSGDVHHAYLARAVFASGDGERSPVYQAVCSPLRNPLDGHERAAIKVAMSRPAERVGHALARAAGVPDERLTWTIEEGPWFDNQVALLELDGRAASLTLEKTVAPQNSTPRLECVMRRRLS
jgi:phosphodiesterase/alkaline phosphatase D-like protein